MADTSIKQFPPCVPGDTLDYAFKWLLASADTITAATFTISPPGPTVSSALIASPVTTAWVSGMSANTIYTLSCSIVTSGGRTAKRSGVIECLPIAP